MSVDFNLTRVRLKPVLDALEGAAADFNLTRVRLKHIRNSDYPTDCFTSTSREFV